MKLTKQGLYEAIIEQCKSEEQAIFIVEYVFEESRTLNENYSGGVRINREGIGDMVRRGAEFYGKHKDTIDKGVNTAKNFAKKHGGKAMNFAKEKTAKGTKFGDALRGAKDKGEKFYSDTKSNAKQGFAKGRVTGAAGNATAQASKGQFAG